MITGALMLVGGGSTTPEMVERFYRLIGGKDQPVVVLALTRENPAESGPASVEWLRENGGTQVSLVAKTTYTLTEKRKLAQMLINAKGVWIPGGDQSLITERLGAEWVQKTFQAALSRGVSFFGTSAGAMIHSNPMIAGTREDGTPILAAGAGTVPFLVDSHYRNRSRENRLRLAREATKNPLSIGLSEGEWVIVSGRKITERFGDPEITD